MLLSGRVVSCATPIPTECRWDSGTDLFAIASKHAGTCLLMEDGFSEQFERDSWCMAGIGP